MIPFLIIFASSTTRTSKLVIYNTYRLPSFAFGENGEAEFSIKSKNFDEKEDFIVLLLNERQHNNAKKINSQRFRKKVLSGEISTKLKLEIDKNHETNNMTIAERGIYFPYIVNKDKSFKIHEIYINYKFKNAKSFVDERERGCSTLYWKLSLIYAVIALIWAINGIKYMQFRVIIHTGFMSLPIIKLIYCILQYKHWKTLADEGVSILDNYISFLSFMFCLMTSLCICASIGGVCILREGMRAKEIRNIIIESLILSIGYITLLNTESIAMFWFSLAITSFSSLWIAKQSIIYMIIISRSCFNSGKHSVTTQKYNLYSQFIKADFVLFILLLVVLWTFFISDIYYIYTKRVAEIIYLIFNIVQMRFFMFRESYIGEPSDKKQKNRSEYYIIRDPNHTFNAFLLTCN